MAIILWSFRLLDLLMTRNGRGVASDGYIDLQPALHRRFQGNISKRRASSVLGQKLKKPHAENAKASSAIL